MIANLKSLNKFPISRVFVAAENGWVEVLELVALFLLKTGTFGVKNWSAISVDAIFALLKFSFEKRRAKTQ